MLEPVAVATGKTPFVKQPTPEKVTYEHIDALNACDVDRLMAQYPESIHIVLPGGATVEGRTDVLGLFTGFCQDYPDGNKGLTFTEVDSWKVHKTINMQWEADECFLTDPYLGADAYETWSGLMAAQVTTFGPGFDDLKIPFDELTDDCKAELGIDDWQQSCRADFARRLIRVGVSPARHPHWYSQIRRSCGTLLLYLWVSFGLGVVVGGCRGRALRGR